MHRFAEFLHLGHSSTDEVGVSDKDPPRQVTVTKLPSAEARMVLYPRSVWMYRLTSGVLTHHNLYSLIM